jgi:hypothetical protein
MLVLIGGTGFLEIFLGYGNQQTGIGYVREIPFLLRLHERLP